MEDSFTKKTNTLMQHVCIMGELFRMSLVNSRVSKFSSRELTADNMDMSNAIQVNVIFLGAVLISLSFQEQNCEMKRKICYKDVLKGEVK